MQPSSFHSSRGKAGRLGGQEGGRSGGREGGWRGRLTLSSSKQNLQRASSLSRPCNTLRVRHRVKRIHAWLHRLCPLPRTEARTTAATPAAVAVARHPLPPLSLRKPKRVEPVWCGPQGVAQIPKPPPGGAHPCMRGIWFAPTDISSWRVAARSHARCPSGGFSALRLLLA